MVYLKSIFQPIVSLAESNSVVPCRISLLYHSQNPILLFSFWLFRVTRSIQFCCALSVCFVFGFLQAINAGTFQAHLIFKSFAVAILGERRFANTQVCVGVEKSSPS